jgi:hypothetical protein
MGDELTCGSVRFQRIVASNQVQKAKADAVIQSEIATINEIIKLVMMRDKIQILKGILARDLDPNNENNKGVRVFFFREIFPYLKAGRIKNDASLDSKIDKKVDEIVAKAVQQGIISADKAAATKESLKFILKTPKYKQIITRQPNRGEAANALIPFANEIGEYAAYGKEGIDLWDATAPEYETIKGTLTSAVKDKFRSFSEGMRNISTINSLLDDINQIETQLERSLRPETRAKIDAAKKVECNSEGKECNDVTDDKLRQGTLVCVKNALMAILALGPASDFELKPPVRDQIDGNTKRKFDTDTATPNTWLYRYDSWMIANPWMPRPILGINIGIGGTPGDLDTRVIGEVDGPITFHVGPTVAADWPRFRLNNYHLSGNVNYAYEYKKALGNNDTTDNAREPAASKHQAGTYVSGLSMTPGFVPDFVLRYNYLNYSSDVPNVPNPNEESSNIRLRLDESFGLKWGGVEAGEHAAWGTANDYDFTRNVFSVGPKLKFNMPFPMIYSAGYRNIYSKQDQSYNSAPSSTNNGHGFYGTAMLDLNGYGAGTFGVNGYLDVMSRHHNEGGLSIDYRRPFNWITLVGGFDYSRQNIGNNGVSDRAVVRIGAEDVYVNKIAAALGLEIAAGYQGLTFDEGSGMKDVSGGVILGNLSYRFGASEKPYRYNINDSRDLYRNYESDLSMVAPNTAKQSFELNQARVLSEDPLVRMLMNSTNVDAQAVAAYVIQFKAGRLNAADYTINSLPKDMLEEAKAVDGNIFSVSAGNGFFGYKPNNTAAIGIGDVAPVGVFVGGREVLTLTGEVINSEYLSQISVMSPDKMRLVKIGVARHKMIDGGMKLKKSNEGSLIAKDLLDIIEQLSGTNEDRVMPKPIISKYTDIKDKNAFQSQLNAELKAQVIGKAVMAMAKYLLESAMFKLKGNIKLDPTEVELIRDASKLTREMVNVIMVYVFLKNNPNFKGVVEEGAFSVITAQAPASAPASQPASQPATPQGDKARDIWNALIRAEYIIPNGEIQPKFNEKISGSFNLNGTDLGKNRKLELSEEERAQVFEIIKDAVQKLPTLDELKAIIGEAPQKAAQPAPATQP